MTSFVSNSEYANWCIVPPQKQWSKAMAKDRSNKIKVEELINSMLC
jgi:hypothetical protein